MSELIPAINWVLIVLAGFSTYRLAAFLHRHKWERRWSVTGLAIVFAILGLWVPINYYVTPLPLWVAQVPFWGVYLFFIGESRRERRNVEALLGAVRNVQRKEAKSGV